MQAINFYIIVDKLKVAPSVVGGLELTESQNKDVRYLKGKVIKNRVRCCQSQSFLNSPI